jgi:hypothetical protein
MKVRISKEVVMAGICLETEKTPVTANRHARWERRAEQKLAIALEPDLGTQRTVYIAPCLDMATALPCQVGFI